ncbi:MAG TPA: HEAT repeat domain-containing protein [Gemmata sp.]
MKSLGACGVFVFALVITLAGRDPARGRDDDPLIGVTPLSTLVAEFKAAKTANERSRWAAAIGAGKEKAASAVPVLAASLKDRDPLVRENIARALGSMGPSAKAAVPDLIAALKDADDSVRNQVLYALQCIGPGAKAAVPSLSEILTNTAEKGRLRVAAAAALGGLGPEGKVAVPLLKKALTDKDTNVRVASALAVYKIDKGNTKAVVIVLREALKDTDVLTRAGAAVALKALGSDAADAVPELMAVLAKGDQSSYYAREALGRIPAAEAALVAALGDPDKKLRQAAASVLLEYFPEAAKKAGLGKK